ncbi:MAG: hypothetical protein GXP62_12010 [Oligoflexia bacterium]|nr:hypothetical protein [Oligoflexia bacterium]
MTHALITLLLMTGCKGKTTSTDDSGFTGSSTTTTTVYDDADNDGFTSDVDCDDSDPAINTSATEICDGVDNDCDGMTDEGVTGAYYVDADGDSFGDPSRIVEACELSDGLVDNADDCDDGDAAVNPDATELCNGIDDNCDEVVDEDTAADATTWYLDNDEDGYGNDKETTVACAAADLYVDQGGDCDDNNATIYPGATEVCDDLDDDCNDVVDDGAIDAPTWYLDDDGDNFGVSDDLLIQCHQEDGYAATPGDCDDSNADINPSAIEICDGVNNDCDDATSEDSMVTFISVDGTISDATSSFSTGTYGAPEGWILPADGTFNFCQGTYYTFVDLQADISLVGLYGADVTILSAGDQDSVVSIGADGVDATIHGLTLRDGSGTGPVYGSRDQLGGGAIYCATSSSVLVEDSILTESTAYIGGAIYTQGCDLQVSNSEISDSTADYGGAVAIMDGTATLSDSTVLRNDATYSGGAIYVDGTTGAAAGVSVMHTLVQDNNALYGGGIAVLDAGMGCTGTAGSDEGFLSNSATLGGAAFLSSPSSFRSDTCDWGDSGDNNTPEDIYLYPYADTFDYGSDETFTCSAFTCSY